jgi:2,4-dienoyl-CoA reductase-like NADH-dependent reductase (Old Yellow Enzyme family)
MTRVSATGTGLATPEMGAYYERFAAGQFGLIVTEGLYTDQAYAQGYLDQPGLSDDDQAASWSSITQRIHAHGAKVIAQLMHSGAISQGNRFVEGTVGPSAVAPLGKQMEFYAGHGPYATPAPMSDTQIADAVSGFADAAVRATTAAGFDGVELHGANGYLLDQFLTDYTNLRDDHWGGDIKARTEVLSAVVRAVKGAVGSSAPVSVRISQGKVNDFTHKWAGGEADAEAIFGSLADLGVDFIHVTEFEAWKPAFGDLSPSLVTLARRHAPSTLIIANGGLHELGRAVEVLEGGADLVAIGRAALSNPDLPRRVAAGEPLRDFDPGILSPLAKIKPSETQQLSLT